MLRKISTTERQLLSQILWTGPQWENSAKPHQDYAKSREEKQIHVSDTKDVCFFREPVYKPSSSSAGVPQKMCVCVCLGSYLSTSNTAMFLLSQV